MSNQIAAPSDVSVTLAPYGAFGPRATALSGDYPVATLFIGIGQVGWQSVSRISTMMADTIAAKDLNHVQYFAVARRPAVIPEGRLGRENSLLLTLEETDWAHVPGRYSGAGVARWWPKPPRDRSLMADYTSIRAYGRLLLYDNPTLVNETILQRVNNLVQASKGPQGDLPRLVVLTASIAEAEGSGMLFDLAWLLRLQLVEAPTTIVAILTADTTAESEQLRTLAVANVYATLKELDAVMANPAQYPVGLPILGGTSRLAAGSMQRPLNYLLVTGDAMKPMSVPPDAALAEMAVTWALSYVGNKGPDLSPLTPPLGKAERFEGYTLFNISKLAMPVGAGIDLIGASLAQQILAGMMTLPPNVSVDEWVETTLAGFKQALVYDKLFEEPKVSERLSELIHKTTAEAMTADVRAKDKDFNMRAFAEGVLRRLEQEDRSVDMIDQGHTAIRLETLRTRAEDSLDALQRRLAATVAGLPTLLSCQQGNGLQWTIVALEELSRRLNEMFNKCREQSS
ncbi:MAG TPA: tubulin-like doman-containing protein, partial [Aggregatilineales bacterium]|nr:tubulin-like doman-containing protein [Aggregatilineales bacterium]